jgi:hypothetical protein
MEDISFQLYKNENLIESNAKTLFKDKRILVCSISEIVGRGLANPYLEYLTNSKKKYNSLGIDNIYVINSTNHIWFLPKVQTFFPELIPLLDYKKEFLNYLQRDKNLSANIDLNKTPYQVLIHNNVIEKIYITREINYKCFELYKKILSYTKNNITKISTINLKKYKNLRQEILINQLNKYILSLKNKNQKYYDFHDFHYAFSRAFYYYDIWPNVLLQEYLEKK